ncbi:MAG TPA: hypothetical protein VMA95_07180 [Streptosporangiaceae bacterium]|nr:hypothetical protein [Streptosporangiaceae bacterium]
MPDLALSERALSERALSERALADLALPERAPPELAAASEAAPGAWFAPPVCGSATPELNAGASAGLVTFLRVLRSRPRRWLPS